MKDKLTEQEIQKSIIDYLNIKGYVVFKHHSTGFAVRDGKFTPFRYSEKGISDIIACSKEGRFIAIEVKKRGGKVSPEQEDFIARVKANGGVAFVAFSLDDAMAEIEALTKGNSAVAHV